MCQLAGSQVQVWGGRHLGAAATKQTRRCRRSCDKAHPQGRPCFRLAGPSNHARQVQFDPAGGATGRHDFEDRILGPDSGPDFGPRALHLKWGAGHAVPDSGPESGPKIRSPKSGLAMGGASAFFMPRALNHVRLLHSIIDFISHGWATVC